MRDLGLKVLRHISKALDAMGHPSRLEIGKFIEKEGKVTFNEIKMNFDYNPNQLQFHMRKLKDAHLIEQKQIRGPYILTDFGKEILKLVSLVENSKNLKKIVSGTTLEEFVPNKS